MDCRRHHYYTKNDQINLLLEILTKDIESEQASSLVQLHCSALIALSHHGDTLERLSYVIEG